MYFISPPEPHYFLPFHFEASFTVHFHTLFPIRSPEPARRSRATGASAVNDSCELLTCIVEAFSACRINTLTQFQRFKIKLIKIHDSKNPPNLWKIIRSTLNQCKIFGNTITWRVYETLILESWITFGRVTSKLPCYFIYNSCRWLQIIIDMSR